MSTVFVTGGSGFVGGAVLRAFRGRHDVRAMARSDRAADAVRALGAEPVRCSLDDVDASRLRGVDAVVHAAAHVEEWGPWEDFLRVNVEGTRRLVDAAREAGVRRFVHVGTEAALFDGRSLVDLDETAPLALSSPFPYSRSKAMAERVVREARGIETIVVRPRLVWGPGDQTILPAVRAMVEAGRFAWIGGGLYRTSTTHVDNLVHALELALTRGVPGSAYFVLDDGTREVRAFLTAYLATAGVALPEKTVPAWVARGAARVIDPLYRLLGSKTPPPVTRFAACMMSVDCTLSDRLARDELGYAPVIGVDEALAALHAAR